MRRVATVLVLAAAFAFAAVAQAGPITIAPGQTIQVLNTDVVCSVMQQTKVFIECAHTTAGQKERMKIAASLRKGSTFAVGKLRCTVQSKTSKPLVVCRKRATGAVVATGDVVLQAGGGGETK